MMLKPLKDYFNRPNLNTEIKQGIEILIDGIKNNDQEKISEAKAMFTILMEEAGKIKTPLGWIDKLDWNNLIKMGAYEIDPYTNAVKIVTYKDENGKTKAIEDIYWKRKKEIQEDIESIDNLLK